MNYVSLSKAAKLVNKSKSTLSSYIKTNKLKASLNGNGVYEILIDDLYEAFKEDRVNRTDGTSNRTPEKALDVALLQERLSSEQALRKQVESERDYLREELQNERVERRTLNLKMAIVESKPDTTTHADKETSLLWKKLFSSKSRNT